MILDKVEEIICRVGKGGVGLDELPDLAVDAAEVMLSEANRRMGLGQKLQAAKLDRMMKDPAGKALTLTMADQVFRPNYEARSARVFRRLIRDYGVPEYLPLHERVAMRVGAIASTFAPELVMPAITWKMRDESKGVILSSNERKLSKHVELRRRRRLRLNFNQLGEAILGEGEAKHRLQQIVERLEREDCNYLSVKISAIFSQINLVAYDETVEAVKERLRHLYRTAIANPVTDETGEKRPKFVNLDMEEYRDLHLTCDAFKQTLDEEEFKLLPAGIVLQAYLPDSFEVLRDLAEWARGRVENGGAEIKVRLVKGANLAMEKVEASLHGWPQAPYSTKDDVDANFKRMLEYCCQPEVAKSIRLGLASHNLFDVAYALLLRSYFGCESRVDFEMLEGMANDQAKVVLEVAGDLLLYAPVVSDQDFHHAIAYLVRRLDENTHEENFLHGIFSMEPGSTTWEEQKKRFLRACRRRHEVADGPNRTQDRTIDAELVAQIDGFANEPDTDWSLRHNVRWIRGLIEKFQQVEVEDIPVVIGGEAQAGGAGRGEGRDPSKGLEVFYHYEMADAGQVDSALKVAVGAQPDWDGRGLEERGALLRQAARELSRNRGESIAVMVRDAGKSVTQADPEISEAIDFATWYAESLSRPGQFDGSEFSPLGVVVITPPWNFPFAIPCGGILAALMAGNSVIIKPAPETVLTAWVMVNQLWDAGIPRDVLQFVPCPDNHIGRRLVTDDRVGAVVLTGAYETGRMFRSWKPSLRLFAETSGKNSMIVTSAADPDVVIKDLVYSAFGHSGQKCSAASLAIIEGSVYDDPDFMRQLKDAAESLPVGPAHDPRSFVTPLIAPPGKALMRGLTELDEGEEWLLEPRMLDDNPCLWTPGIRVGVRSGGWYHRTECFGPILGLMRATNLAKAIEIQNDNEFGLTGGIHTLDPEEIEQWRDSVEVGNAYVSRPTTGAIVRRQAFGGWKKSCFGPGNKAGGPNYVGLFGQWEQKNLPEMKAELAPRVGRQLERMLEFYPEYEAELRAAAGSYAYWWKTEFGEVHDPSQLLGESNQFRYVAKRKVWLRVNDAISGVQVLMAMLAANTVQVRLDLSLAKEDDFIAELATGEVVVEDERSLIGRITEIGSEYEFLRMLDQSPHLFEAANQIHLTVLDCPVLANGRIELLRYLREQIISESLHRYGNLIPSPADITKQAYQFNVDE